MPPLPPTIYQSFLFNPAARPAIGLLSPRLPVQRFRSRLPSRRKSPRNTHHLDRDVGEAEMAAGRGEGTGAWRHNQGRLPSSKTPAPLAEFPAGNFRLSGRAADLQAK
jgi:hypothetical protein